MGLEVRCQNDKLISQAAAHIGQYTAVILQWASLQAEGDCRSCALDCADIVNTTLTTTKTGDRWVILLCLCLSLSVSVSVSVSVTVSLSLYLSLSVSLSVSLSPSVCLSVCRERQTHFTSGCTHWSVYGSNSAVGTTSSGG